MNTYIRINGTGNAWPTFIGEQHPFYWDNQPESMSNVSFSIFGIESKNFDLEKTLWSLLIDAGHGTVQQIIKNENRIPDALLLTHHHLDHTLAIDWVIQSYWHKHDKRKKYPVYASALCWQYALLAYPHLEKMIELKELIPGVSIDITEAPGVTLIPYPVYHGPKAPGAMMLVLQYENKKKSVFTGDCLCPLLRKCDYEKLVQAAYMFVDANNRFSYPLCNHWSVTSLMPDSNEKPQYLKNWIQALDSNQLLAPHKLDACKDEYTWYFNDFIRDYGDHLELYFSIFDFIKRVNPSQTGLVHYGGIEDKKYHGQSKLSKNDLLKWIMIRKKTENVNHDIFIPVSGNIYKI